MDPRVLTSGSRPWFVVAVALAVRDDPVRSKFVAGETLLGTTAREAGIAQRRRAAERAAPGDRP
jgi:hypothetical protein